MEQNVNEHFLFDSFLRFKKYNCSNLLQTICTEVKKALITANELRPKIKFKTNQLFFRKKEELVNYIKN